eukprot:jgi/Hompol1/5148/HPOL_001894-RA
MQSYTINGVHVNFPFKIIRAIKESQNALLESPTGTGKTLTILSSVLAWREAEHSRIIAAKEELAKRVSAAAKTEGTEATPARMSRFFPSANATVSGDGSAHGMIKQEQDLSDFTNDSVRIHKLEGPSDTIPNTTSMTQTLDDVAVIPRMPRIYIARFVIRG